MKTVCLRFLTILAWITCLSANAQEPVERKLPPFHSLVAGDKIIVRLISSDEPEVIIKSQGISAEAVVAEVREGVLHIKLKSSGFSKRKVIVDVHFQKLSKIEVTGGADVTFSSLYTTDTLSVICKSGGMLYLDADVKNIACRVTEGGLVTAEGYAESAYLVAASSGTFSGYNLECTTVHAIASSGGIVKIMVTDELNAEATTKGFISFKGKPGKGNRTAISGGSIVLSSD